MKARATSHVGEFLRNSHSRLRDARRLHGWRLRPVAAIAWEFWTANRRGWYLVLALFAAGCALSGVFAESIRHSEGFHFLSYITLTASVILAISFCNFTDRNRRDGIAGFPRHLFAMPISTNLIVTCAMACSLLSVVGVYVAWAQFVLKPLDSPMLIRWPATLLATFIVLYQSIVWCLCGFRLTRVISLSLVATILVAVGFLPTLQPKDSFWASEMHLSTSLMALMAVAYVATLVTVNAQRRGAARGWTGLQELVERLASAIPRRQVALTSPDAALFWIEWRRAGYVLPAAVLLTTALILGPVLAFTGRGREATTYAEMWLAFMPILLAFPIGLGYGKPDFWSLELSLSPFAATRPITAGQLLAAKLKSAAGSTLLAWVLLLIIAPLCIYLFCDTKHWDHLWSASGMLYSSLSQWLLPILFLIGAMLMTWSLLVANIWLGYSGRPGVYYSVTSIGLAAFVTWFFWFIWWLDHPRSRGDTFVGFLPWLPGALAALIAVKVWIAVLAVRVLRQRSLVSDRGIAVFGGVWLSATTCLVLAACLVSPRIEWFRYTALLAALVAFPMLTVASVPLAIAWNRHRSDGRFASRAISQPTVCTAALKRPSALNSLPIIFAACLTGGTFWLAHRAFDDLPGRVDVDGRQLRMRVEGAGSPAVVLEIGLGGPLEVWDMVQPEVARFTKVVAYDRIGAVDTKASLTGEEVARELRDALRAAGVQPPYVLVGQSFGGIYNRLFASLYPDEVEGMVLLDPTQEEFLDWVKVHYPKHTLNKRIVKNWAEGAGIWDTLDQLKASEPLPDVPVIVVTGTRFIDDEMRIKTLPKWTESHANWVNSLPRGRHVLAAESGHGVEIEAPGLVVDLVRDVVEQARSQSSLSAGKRGPP